LRQTTAPTTASSSSGHQQTKKKHPARDPSLQHAWPLGKETENTNQKTKTGSSLPGLAANDRTNHSLKLVWPPANKKKHPARDPSLLGNSTKIAASIPRL
jgi:hypothetical protein